VRVESTVDAAPIGTWSGRVGPVTDLLDDLVADPARTVAFLCGPEIMMRFASAALLRLGVPRSAVFVSLERNMKCAIGVCGHCQLGPDFVCREGPVFPLDRAARYFEVREL
jgi:NAD(P)H-flavin reductase